jgi:riboflavin kinase/FMN adenylyltransferase
MKIYGNILTEYIQVDRGTALVIGKFDGLHRGHRALIEMLSKAKKEEGMLTAIFTFVRSPMEALEKTKQQYILTAEEKRLFMEKNGIDILVECPLEPEILSIEPEAFIEDILVKKLNVKKIFCGEDCGFGYKRRGNATLLKKLEDKFGYKTTVIKKLQYDGRDISSTYIREEICKGNVETVNELLGYPYTAIGVVTKGQQLGRTLGFPTFNIIPPKDKLLLPKGVYYTNSIIDGVRYPSITNIGTRPTVSGDGNITIETNILDVSIDLYKQTLELEFFKFIRSEKKFNSTDELKAAVENDIRLCREENERLGANE